MPSYGDTLTEMLGSEQWIPIVEGSRREILSPAEARAEWVNLMRWRLQHELGYRSSYGFTMKNTNGQDLYDMIYVTDHEAGDKIMRHLYGRALAEHEAMRRHALSLRQDKRRQEYGMAGLFDISPEMASSGTVAPAQIYVPEPPHEPYTLPRPSG